MMPIDTMIQEVHHQFRLHHDGCAVSASAGVVVVDGVGLVALGLEARYLFRAAKASGMITTSPIISTTIVEVMEQSFLPILGVSW